MRGDIYHDMARQQEIHWWFKARREILHTILKKYILTKRPDILEVGCGTGGNLLMLKKFGHVSAMEMDEFASDYASKTTGIDVKTGWLPDNTGANAKQYHLIHGYGDLFTDCTEGRSSKNVNGVWTMCGDDFNAWFEEIVPDPVAE